MPSSQQRARQPARLVLLAVLLTANVLLYAAWPWLRQMPLKGDSSEPFVLRNVIRNEAYLARFFETIRSKQKIFFLGTSESAHPYNLGSQLNSLAQADYQIAVLANAGISPIHSALAMARAKREGIQIPPTILVINPVYFTDAYDLINDGWMSRVLRSPVFLQMNHRDVRDYLSPDVREAYNEHFALKRFLYPATAQEYLGNLLYLSFHQPAGEPERAAPLPIPVYNFNGVLPTYDTEENVWTGKDAVDRFSKNRWHVSSVEESFNLKGLASTVATFQNEPAPLLLVFLPVNRKFYEYHGLDMDEFDRRFRAIRSALKKLARGENIYLLDLYDVPQLRFGFKDRMHMDQYGFFQLASHMIQDETYARFLSATNRYYNAPSAGAQTAAHREPVSAVSRQQ